ncbi:hypothetical protein [Scytonema sp. UIC 10036]|uniref:hypothetical protein n=1 Tax=Scytonema sp. UIC 10036 TaxID=2304196 RepID=UPI00325ACFD1
MRVVHLNKWGWCWKLGLGIILVANCCDRDWGQITTDTTLGAENSVVVRDILSRGINSDRIDGGAVRGANLFHSFQEFNIREDKQFISPIRLELRTFSAA